MAFRPKPKSEFGVLAKYVKFIKDNFPRAKVIRPGEFYAYTYRFDKTQYPYSELKFWDVMPLVFVYELHKNKENEKMFRAINFHHAPVRPRQIWLNRTINLTGEAFERNKRLTRLASWQRLFVMMKKISKKTVRQYYLKRMIQPRHIPNDRVEEVIRYYARTYYGISISQVEAQYLIFRL